MHVLFLLQMQQAVEKACITYSKNQKAFVPDDDVGAEAFLYIEKNKKHNYTIKKLLNGRI